MPRADADWQVFNIDAVEDALVTILNAAEVRTNGRRSTEKRVTPCCEIALNTKVVQGQRFLRFPTIQNALVQPFNTWMFTLDCEIYTDRTANGSEHAMTVAKTRGALQYYSLTTTLTPTVCPYHSITDIRETNVENDTDEPTNLDITRLTFEGMLNIRDTAWPLIS